MSNKKRIKNFKSSEPLKKRSTRRNWIKTSMDRFTSPAVHRSRLRTLEAKEADKELLEHLRERE